VFFSSYESLVLCVNEGGFVFSKIPPRSMNETRRASLRSQMRTSIYKSAKDFTFANASRGHESGVSLKVHDLL
jgi:hypothetical protein